MINPEAIEHYPEPDDSVSRRAGWMALEGSASHLRELSPRQAEVLELISLGLNNKQIGKRLGIAPGTVVHYGKGALWALPARDRAQAVRLAIEKGQINIEADSSPYEPLNSDELDFLRQVGKKGLKRAIEMFQFEHRFVEQDEILRKLKVVNFPQAIRRAFELGIFEAPSPPPEPAA